MMSIKGGERLPHRRILTGFNLIVYDDSMAEKEYNIIK